MTFEKPTKDDLDRNLSEIASDAYRNAAAEKMRITKEFASRGVGQSTGVTLSAMAAIDAVHKDALIAAMSLVKSFAERMNVTAKDASLVARSHLKNLGQELLGKLPSAGFQKYQQDTRTHYQHVFLERLNGALRDLKVGFIGQRNVAMKDADRRAIILNRLYEERHLRSWIRILLEDN